MIVQFAELLLRDIRERQGNIKDTLASGSITSMEQYRYFVGRTQGLEEAIVVAQELFDKMVENRPLTREHQD